MFGAIDSLLAKIGVRARDIGVVVVNCSLFNSTLSLFTMVVNHYKLRGNVASYNLGSMGCSAGLISINLAKQLLQVNFLYHSSSTQRRVSFVVGSSGFSDHLRVRAHTSADGWVDGRC